MMRSLTFLAGLGAAALMSSTALAGEQTYKVDLNKTEIVRLPGHASAVVIGNPTIADVTVHSTNTLFVVGRGFGETNLIVLDKQGRTMMDANIQVMHTTPRNGVRLFNAKSRESYNCAPYCQPSPVLGDNGSFISANTAEQESVDPLTALFNAASESFGGGSGGSGQSSSSSSGTGVMAGDQNSASSFGGPN